MTIKLLNTGIRIRPSAVDTFFGCSYQWGKTFLEGVTTIPSARAARGTAIHKAAEVLWTDAMETGEVDANLSKMTDAAVQTFQEEVKTQQIKFDEGETEGKIVAEIVKGAQSFVEDIVPFCDIPDGVEQFYKVDLLHPIVKELGGTIDYIADGIIADLKTSSRKPTVSKYKTQQSIYRYLAEANGRSIHEMQIQSIIMKSTPEGAILPIETDVSQAKALVNSMLDTLELVAKDVAPIETILRGNPGYMFCSPKYCSQYEVCPFVKGRM